MEDSLFTTPRIWDHQVEGDMIDNVLRVLCYSMNNTPVASNTGMVIEFSILVSSEPNYYPLEISEVILNGEDGSNEYTGHNNGVLTVLPSDEISYLRLSSNYLNFSVVPPDDSLDMELVLYNDGTEDITITDIESILPFVNIDDSFVIAGNSSYATDIGFYPTAEGIYTDTLKIYTSDEVVSVLLYGESADIIPYDADIHITEELIDFGEVYLASDSIGYVTVTNAGLGDLLFEDLSVTPEVFEVLDPVHTHRQTVSLDGSNDYVYYGNAGSIGLPSGNSSFTVEAWIRPDNMEDTQTIMSWGRYDANSQSNQLKLTNTQLRHSFRNNDIYVEVGDLTDSWHHVAVSYTSGGERRLFLDGVLIGSDTPSANVHGSYDFNVGRRNDGYDYFDGFIDEVRISNYGIYTADFTPEVELGVTGNTVGLWHYDTNYEDATGYGHSGSGQSGASLASGGVYNAYVLPPDRVANIPIKFAPVDETYYAGSLVVMTNDIDESVLSVDLTGTGIAYHSNVLILGDVEVEEGGSVRVPVSIENTDIITGFQFDVTLPEGVTFMEDSLFTTPRIWDHQVYATQNNQILSIFAYSMNLNPIAGNTGLVFEFTIKTGPGVTTYPLIINNLILAQSDMQNVATDSDYGTINILSSPIFRTDVSQVLFFNFVEDTLYNTVEFYNDGSEVLEMEFNIIGEQFFIVDDNITIEQNSNVLFTIGCTPTGDVEVEGILNISTNDPNNADLEILLLNILQYSMTSTEYDFGNLMIDSLYSRSIGFENFTDDSVNIQLTIESDVFSLTNNTLDLGLGHSEIPLKILSTEYGFYLDTVYVTVNDSIPLSSIALNVNFYENYAPEINISDILQLNEDTPTIFEYSVEDPNDDVIVVDIQYDSGYLSIEHTDTTIFVVPQENWNGETSINIFISDGNLITESIVDIVVLPLNDPPIVTIPIEDIQIDEDSENLFITLEPYFSDVDINSNEDSLFYSIGDIDYELISTSILSNNILIVEFIQDVNGIAHLEIIATDVTGEFISSGFNIEILPVNDAPFILNPLVDIVVDEDSEDSYINLLNVFEDVDVQTNSDELIYTLNISDTILIDAIIVENEFLIIEYLPEQSGVSEIAVSCSDIGGFTVIDSLIITVNQINDVPIVDEILDQIINEDETISVEISANDVDSDSLIFSVYSDEPSIALSLNENQILLQPQDNWFGESMISVTVSDGEFETSTEFTLVVNSVNDLPIAYSQEVSINEDEFVNIQFTASDVENDNLAFSITDQPENGIISGELPSIIYTPNTDYYGNDVIVFTVSDGEYVSEDATIIINIAPVQDVPIVQDLVLQTNEDNPLVISISGYDADDDSLSYYLLSEPDYGIIFGELPDIVYMPNNNYFGQDNFTFTAFDGIDSSEVGNVSISINSINDAPELGTIGNQIMNEDDSLSFVLFASDFDDLVLTFSAFTNESNVALNIEDSLLTIDLNENWYGEAEITVIVNDQRSRLTDTETFILTVNPVNDPPILEPIGLLEINEDTVLEYLLDVSDVDGDSISISGYGNNENIDINIVGEILTVTPIENYNGTTIVTILVDDNNGEIDTETFDVIVLPMNDMPIAEDIYLETSEDIELELVYSGEDIDGDTLDFIISIYPENGTVENGIYFPHQDYFGSDSLFYIANDGDLASEPAKVFISILPINDTPIVNAGDDQEVTVTHDGSPTSNTATITFSGYGEDVDGDSLLYSWLLENEEVSDELLFDLDITAGEYTFILEVSDGFISVTDEINVLVYEEPNEIPVANHQEIETNEDVALNIILEGFDTDEDILTFYIANNVVNGQITGEIPSLIYIPDNNYYGQDSLTFYINDGYENSETATISINIIPLNDLPIISEISNQQMLEDEAITIPIEVSDIDGDSIYYSAFSSNVNIFTNLENNNLIITSTLNYFGDSEIIITGDDQNGGVDSENFIISVIPVNDPPIALENTIDIDEDDPVFIQLEGEDVDDDTLTFFITEQPNNGNVSGELPNIQYTPNEEWSGIDSLYFTVFDGEYMSIPALVEINVLFVNDPPEIQPITNQEMDEDETLTVDIVVFDAEEDSLLYSVESNNSLVNVLIIESQLQISAEQDYFGEADITITVSEYEESTSLTSLNKSGMQNRNNFTPNNRTTRLEDSESFHLTILPINDTPFVFDVDTITNEDVVLDISFDGDDVDGDVLEYFVLNGPFNGQYSNGVYIPNADYFGNDSLTYIAFDGELYSDTASVFIEVIESNDAPIAEDLNIELDEDTTVEIEFIGSDIEGDELSYIIYEEPIHGNVEGNIYTPYQDYFGSDSLFYIANDGDLASEPAKVFISILPINDTPIISEIENQIIEEDSTLQIILSSLNIDEDILYYSAISDTGSVIIAIIDDTLNITLEENWFGESIIFVTVSDGEFETSTEFTLVVNPVNDLPSEFHLTSPETESEVLLSDVQDGIEFIWTESFDIEGDTLIYLFTITDTLYNELFSQEIDVTSITVTDTTLLNILQTLDADTLLTKWFVSVSDGVEITESVEEYNLTIIDDITLGIDDLTLLPTKYNLSQNYPNPFNPITTIEFALPKRTNVKLVVYDLQGRKVYTLINNNLHVGYHSVQWNGINKFGNQVSSGVYIYMLETADYGKVQKMVLLK